MRSLIEMVCGVATTIFNPEKPGRLTGVMRRTGEGHVEVDNSQETVASLSEDAPAHGADAAGMLEALFPPRLVLWRRRKTLPL